MVVAVYFNKNRQTAVTNIINRNVNEKTPTIKCHDIIHDKKLFSSSTLVLPGTWKLITVAAGTGRV